MMRQLGEKPAAVIATMEDVRTAVTPAGDVVDGVRKVNSRRARHDDSLAPGPADGNATGGLHAIWVISIRQMQVLIGRAA
jgi:hypothetical protein